MKTIQVVHPESSSHYLFINESDFDSAIHQVWGEDAPKVNIDAPKELNAAQSDVVPESEPLILTETATETKLAADYEAELAGADWRELKALAEDLGVEKDPNGWEETIPAIAIALAAK